MATPNQQRKSRKNPPRPIIEALEIRQLCTAGPAAPIAPGGATRFLPSQPPSVTQVLSLPTPGAAVLRFGSGGSGSLNILPSSGSSSGSCVVVGIGATGTQFSSNISGGTLVFNHPPVVQSDPPISIVSGTLSNLGTNATGSSISGSVVIHSYTGSLGRLTLGTSPYTSGPSQQLAAFIQTLPPDTVPQNAVLISNGTSLSMLTFSITAGNTIPSATGSTVLSENAGLPSGIYWNGYYFAGSGEGLQVNVTPISNSGLLTFGGTNTVISGYQYLIRPTSGVGTSSTQIALIVRPPSTEPVNDQLVPQLFNNTDSSATVLVNAADVSQSL